MESSGIHEVVEYVAQAIELLGIIVIVVAILYAIPVGLSRFFGKKKDGFVTVKTLLGKALQLALEFLIAADIIRTIIIAPTLENVLVLGLLIIVRTILSWSITVEIEGCWPWKVSELKEE